MEFGLLGPLVVSTGGARMTVTAGKQRVLLAALLLRPNQVVPATELGTFTWEGSPPGSARVTLQNYVKRLRQVLGSAGPERIVTRSAGYMINVSPGELDVARFGELRSAGRAAACAGAWDAASAQLASALDLWRGQPLEDVPSQALALAEVPRLAEMRLGALEDRIDADLHLGRHHEVIAELQALIAAEPLRERLHELLMLALYRAGRQAAALAVYREARRQLIEDVGLEPGPGLRQLNQQILQADSALLLPRGPSAASAAPAPAGALRALTGGQPKLPSPGVAGFTGRTAQLRAMSAAARPGRDPEPEPVITIGGTGGVGKTALAVHWVHEHAHLFPDGQLHVDLRGFGPGDPLSPAEALRGFLDTLAVPAEHVPASFEARQALYRGLVDGRRIVVLLDNARDSAQVRPLLPGTPAALVLATSRDQLAGLAAGPGRHIDLDVLSSAEACEMLARRLGRPRVGAEPAAVAELAASCARLPLALAVVAARAAAHPCFSLAALAAELSDADGRLDALATGEESTDVRTVMSWSYRRLSPAAARMFRLLGLYPDPKVTLAGAARQAGLDLAQARRQLAELTRGHLLAEDGAGRYRWPGLCRAYAAELAA